MRSLMNIAEPMTSLYESLFDVDDNIDEIDKSLLIGGQYDIDVKNINYFELKRVFKMGVAKITPKYNLINPPKIDIDPDKKINNIIETICRIILNIPIHDLNNRSSITLGNYCPEIIDMVKGYGGCRITRTVGGQVYFCADAKSIRVDIGNGIKTYKTPKLTIPLIKK